MLVLGATSLIGAFLPAHLSPLVGVGRGEGRPPGYRWVRADLTAPDLATPPAETVVSLAPIWLLPAALPALAEGGMRRLVAFSSTSRWTKAASPDAGERAVAARLADGEDAVQAVCAAQGVAWTILRPTLIYAEGRDGNVSRLASLARRFGVLPISGAGEGLRQPVHADDLAAAVAAVIASPPTHDRTYDLPGGETLSYRQMCVSVFEGLGRPPRLLHAPPAVWRLALAAASPWMPGATAAMGERMAQDLVFDPGPAQRDFGWAPRPFSPDFAASPRSAS